MENGTVVELVIRKPESSEVKTGLMVTVASSFFGRLVGLLSHSSLNNNEAMLLKPCASIHTFFMRFTIDVVFLSDNGKVLGYADSVKPNQFRISPSGTRQVLEVAHGNRIRTGINLDDYLIFG